MAKKLDLEVAEAISTAKYKYLCPACTNEVMFSNKPKVLNPSVYCHHCGLSKNYDPSRWVKIEE